MKRPLFHVSLMQRLITMALIGSPLAIQAQGLTVDPGARLLDDLRRADRLAPALPPSPASPVPSEAPRLQGLNLQGRVVLSEIQFSPSVLLPDSDLRRLAQPYLNRELVSSDLNQLLADIQRLYLERGIETAVPVVPPQDLAQGSLRILLVEGKLGRLRATENSRLDPDWLQGWFRQKPGDIIRVTEFEQDLALLNASSDARLQGQLIAGGEFGLSDYQLGADVANASQPWALLEWPQAGSRAVDGASLMLGYRLAPAGPWAARVDATAIQTPVATTLSLTGGLPLPARGWKAGLSLSGTQSRSTVASTTAGSPDLVIEGQSQSLGLDLSHLSTLANGQFLRLQGSLSQLHTQSSSDGQVLSNRSIQRLSLTASTDWFMSTVQVPQALTASLRASLNAGQGPAGAYSFAEMGVNGSWRLGPAMAPTLRMNYQMRMWPDHTPDAIDTWLAGGSSTVRGFNLGALTGVQGRNLQMSLHQSLPTRSTPIELMAFVDHAHARTASGEDRSIASAGWGLQVKVNARWTLDAINSRQVSGATGDRTRLLLRLNTSW